MKKVSLCQLLPLAAILLASAPPSHAATVKALSFAVSESIDSKDRTPIKNYMIDNEIDFGIFDFTKATGPRYFLNADFPDDVANFKVGNFQSGNNNYKHYIYDSNKYVLENDPSLDKSGENIAVVFRDANDDMFALLGVRGTYKDDKIATLTPVKTFIDNIAEKYPGATIIVTYNARLTGTYATTGNTYPDILNTYLTQTSSGPQMSCLDRTSGGGAYMYPGDVPTTYSVTDVNDIGTKYPGTLVTLTYPMKYKVIFNDWDGTGLQTNVVFAGGSVTPPTPTRSGYTFTGWDHTASEFASVTASFTATAQYEILANSHTVRFLDEDGETVIDERAVADGTAATAPDAPTHVGKHFVGWLLAGQEYNLATPVTGDLTLVASYAANFYDVTFLDWNDNQLGNVQSVEHGTAAMEPELPAIPSGKVFWRWSADFSAVTGSLVVQASLFDALTEIGTAAVFNEAIVDGAPAAAVFRLTADIALDGWTAVGFAGTLDGHGHTLSGLGANSLFVTNSGTIANLAIDGTVSGANTTRSAAAIMGVFCDVSEGATFTNCIIRGYTLRETTSSYAGLFAGTAYDGTTFADCLTDQGCQVVAAGANATIGGFVGRISCHEADGVIASFTDCTNNAAISTSNGDNSAKGKGGFVGYIGQFGSGTIPEVVFTRCANNGTLTTTFGNMYMGGFVGRTLGLENSSDKKKDLTVRFVDCDNTADITAGTATIGGFVGTMTSASAVFNGCANRGNVSSQSTAAGLVGSLSGYGKTIGDGTIILNSANYGNVVGTNNAAGFVGTVSWNVGWNSGKYHVYNSATYGTVATGEEGVRGEIMGKASSGTGSSVVFLFDNIWTPTAVLYTSSSKAPTATDCQSADTEGYTDAAALSALQTVANDNVTYERWKIGPSGHPELARWVPPSSTIVILR